MVLFVFIGVRGVFVEKLEIRFLAHGVMDVLRIVYPQYWIGMHKLYLELLSTY
jgi:hypothetical protein